MQCFCPGLWPQCHLSEYSWISHLFLQNWIHWRWKNLCRWENIEFNINIYINENTFRKRYPFWQYEHNWRVSSRLCFLEISMSVSAVCTTATAHLHVQTLKGSTVVRVAILTQGMEKLHPTSRWIFHANPALRSQSWFAISYDIICRLFYLIKLVELS